MTYQNLWDTAKVVLLGKFITMTAYMKWSERSQINATAHSLKEKNKQIPKQEEGEK
jgi:hypothetical protein